MRYRVKVVNLSRPKSPALFHEQDEPLVFDAESSSSSLSGDLDAIVTSSSGELVKRSDVYDPQSALYSISNHQESQTTSDILDSSHDYLVQNWQFEIRKLTFDDAGTYQCLLPLVKPISKNITLQVLRKLCLLIIEN